MGDARKAFGWSINSMKRVGVYANASLLVIDMVSEQERVLIGGFNNGPWKESSLHMYGRNGFVFVDDHIYPAKDPNAHMISKPGSVDFGNGALTLSDGFAINSEFCSVYDSPPLTPVHDPCVVERVRLFTWADEDEAEISVLNNPRYGAERLLIQLGTRMNQISIDREHFA